MILIAILLTKVAATKIRYLQPVTTNSSSYSVGPSVSVSNYVSPYGSALPSPYVSVSNYPSPYVSNYPSPYVSALSSPYVTMSPYVSAPPSPYVTMSPAAISSPQQGNIFTDYQWTAILVPSLGISLFLFCCIYDQQVKIKQLEKKLQKQFITTYNVPFHSTMRHVIAPNQV